MYQKNFSENKNYDVNENFKGNTQFVQKMTFEPLIDFKQNHSGSWKYDKSCNF